MKKLITGLMLAAFLTVSAAPVIAMAKPADTKDQKTCHHKWWKLHKKDECKDTSK